MKPFLKGVAIFIANAVFTLLATSLLNFLISITFMIDFIEIQHSAIWIFSVLYFIVSTLYLISTECDD
jgi:predicted membrane protein